MRDVLGLGGWEGAWRWSKKHVPRRALTVAGLEDLLRCAVKVGQRVSGVGVLVQDVRVGDFLVETVGHANVGFCRRG